MTIFSVPKPFKKDINTIQRNAIFSWLKLRPKCEIILFGDEEGTDKIAQEFNIFHIPEIKKNKYGTPLINDIFEKAKKLSKHDILVYVNSDIVLMSDFVKAIEKIKEPSFLIFGRRTDLRVEKLINFEKSDWEKDLGQRAKKEGNLHGLSGIDYFVFTKGIWGEIPPFALGRTAWDNWLLYQAWLRNMPLIDATEVVTAIHQNHDYSHAQKQWAGVWKGPEAKENIRLAGGIGHLLTIRDANFILTPNGFKKSKLTIYKFLSFPFRYFDKSPIYVKIFLFPGWLLMIAWRRLNIFLK